MKIAANRLMLFAASALAFGTVAFGQTSATAQIPFAFRTASGTLPAGNYKFARVRLNGVQHLVVARNASGQSKMVGLPTFEPNANHYGPTPKQGIDFTCYGQVCALKAIRMSDGTLVYAIPDKAWAEKGAPLARVSIPLVPVGE